VDSDASVSTCNGRIEESLGLAIEWDEGRLKKRFLSALEIPCERSHLEKESVHEIHVIRLRSSCILEKKVLNRDLRECLLRI